MIKSNQRILNRIQVLVDAGVILAAYVYAMRGYFDALVFVVPAYLFLYYLCHIYTPRRSVSRMIEMWNILRANVAGILCFVLVLYLVKQESITLRMLLTFFVLNVLGEIFVRTAIRYLLYRIRRQGFNQKHILLVGCSKAAKQYLERIEQNAQWGYNVFGILSDSEEQGECFEGAKILGKIAVLEHMLANHDLDEVVITLGMQEYEKLEQVVAICEKAGVHTKFVLDYGTVIPTKPEILDVQGLPVINIRKVPLSMKTNQWVKRFIDVCGAIAAIIIFSPVMLLTAIAVKISSEGSVIFKQERVGRHGKSFQMYKFRSMVLQDAESEKEKWTVKDDPRVTPLGRFIRKTSVDELPQLFNVLKGEMSLVGPRPERPQFVEKFKEEIPRYMVKHQVRPGMTGWAQIHGLRGDTSIEKRIEYDLYYIENWTVGLDIKIIIFTLIKGFINEEH